MSGKVCVQNYSQQILYLLLGYILLPAPVHRRGCIDSKKMVMGVSPRIIFDIVMTKFKSDYNPTIIYDASCRAKEMGLNREPGRFLKIKFASDPLHIENHTTCSAAFRSTLHAEMRKLNKKPGNNSILC